MPRNLKIWHHQQDGGLFLSSYGCVYKDTLLYLFGHNEVFLLSAFFPWGLSVKSYWTTIAAKQYLCLKKMNVFKLLNELKIVKTSLKSI